MKIPIHENIHCSTKTHDMVPQNPHRSFWDTQVSGVHLPVYASIYIFLVILIQPNQWIAPFLNFSHKKNVFSNFTISQGDSSFCLPCSFLYKGTNWKILLPTWRHMKGKKDIDLQKKKFICTTLITVTINLITKSSHLFQLIHI